MKTSDNGINLIKKFEGLKTKAYKCPAGVWTIGYGHTSGVLSTDTCTKEQATNWLKQDVKTAENAIEKYVKVELNQNQFDALVSFIYNVGSVAFRKSTMLKFINNKHFPLAAGQFDLWIYSKGVKLEGLIARRKAEKELFLRNSVE
ncbi:MAG: lysozyme [Candidatus Gastranaerophilales bacterium]|nr:lysozyme [Candidatus Gastranaerophilales bacterium]